MPTEDAQVIRTGTDNIKRVGSWDAPAALHIVTITGAITLDFREATLAGPVTDVEVQSGTGSINLILPAGATADVNGLAVGTGHVHDDVPSGRGGGPHFVLRGEAGTGAVRVAYSPKRFGIF